MSAPRPGSGKQWWARLPDQPAASDEDVREFCARWEFGQDVHSMLKQLDPQFCSSILQDFKPPPRCSRLENLLRFIGKAKQILKYFPARGLQGDPDIPVSGPAVSEEDDALSCETPLPKRNKTRWPFSLKDGLSWTDPNESDTEIFQTPKKERKKDGTSDVSEAELAMCDLEQQSPKSECLSIDSQSESRKNQNLESSINDTADLLEISHEPAPCLEREQPEAEDQLRTASFEARAGHGGDIGTGCLVDQEEALNVDGFISRLLQIQVKQEKTGEAPGNEDIEHPHPQTGVVIAVNEGHFRKGHVEKPQRVATISDSLRQEGILERCKEVECCEVTDEDLQAVHAKEHILRVEQTSHLNDKHDLQAAAANYDSMYLTNSSFACARIAAGSASKLTEKVITGKLRNGFAVVRPPGHHATISECCGFCVFNNIAVAASAAKRRFGLKRILIVDWDVHHGNGTQTIFYNDCSTLFFSVHRHDGGAFWPPSEVARPRAVGQGAAMGYNINVAWNLPREDKQGMGDAEYLAVWDCLLLPVAEEFSPELILVSAGFDSAVGDNVGGCGITPQGFAQMTRMLQSVCPKVVLSLEGGYDLEGMKKCACACTNALLGDPVNFPSTVRPKSEACASITKTLQEHQRFWKSLKDQQCSGEISLRWKDKSTASSSQSLETEDAL